MYAFHAAISIRYWFAIDIAIRYRYRSYPAFPIARGPRSPVAARCAYYYPSISCFLCTFPQALNPTGGRGDSEPLENRSNPLRLGRSLALPERSRFGFGRTQAALRYSWKNPMMADTDRSCCSSTPSHNGRRTSRSARSVVTGNFPWARPTRCPWGAVCRGT
uniref:Uncharacterized protein n=4 Tax=Candidatus Kentrum sp. FM TaxID=2126340 RepID=A0A450TZK1_9GAMM|nr:MAG: hypothetical protein BECKFM1743C_GA0114222_108413 [Candidatus Kentron sp. FM]